MPLRDQTEGDDETLLRRILAFGDAVGRDTADRVEAVAGGHAVLSHGLDLLHDASYLSIEEPGRSATELAAVGDEIMRGEGLSGIHVSPLDPREAERLEPGFRELGWKIEPGIYMAHRRPPDRPAAHPAAELRGDEVGGFFRELTLEAWASDYAGDPDAVADQFAARERGYAASRGDRWFVAEDGGAPAACCYLLEDGGLGQVETVVTAEASRNKGLGRAVVLAAVDASVRSGNEVTFIGAEADDWPHELYSRLGFDRIGKDVIFQIRANAGGTPPGPARSV